MSAEVHRYTVGECGVTVVMDGTRTNPVAGLVTNAGAEEVSAALSAAGLPTDKLTNSYAPVLLEVAGQRILIDTGNGPAAFAESKGQAGRLHHNLAEAGIALGSIDTVICSHFHADHVNGLRTAAGKPAFPNAVIRVPEVEWAFWMSDDEMARAPAGRMQGLFANNRRVFDALDRKVTPFSWDTEVAPGVRAVGTPGHSIGHTSFLIGAGRERLMIQSDVCNHPILFAQHPTWQGWFDQDPVAAVATRRRVYDMLAAERIRVQAYHFPFPACGRIEKMGDGYRFVPDTAA